LEVIHTAPCTIITTQSLLACKNPIFAPKIPCGQMSFIFRQFLQEQIAKALQEQKISYPSHQINLELASKTKEGDCYLAVPNIMGKSIEETGNLIKDTLINNHPDLIADGRIEEKEKRNQAYLYLTFQPDYFKAEQGAFMDYLTANDSKESLSFAYLSLLAGINRLSIEKPMKDKGVDARILAQIQDSQIQIGVQLKSTTIKNCQFEDEILIYLLDNGNYVQLIASKQQVPLILVLLVLPEDVNTWLMFEPDALILRSTMYWVCLAEEPASTKSKIPVKIPIQNQLTVHSLTQIMNVVYADFWEEVKPNHKGLLQLSKGELT
jgi:hypothetical protein